MYSVTAMIDQLNWQKLDNRIILYRNNSIANFNNNMLGLKQLCPQ